MICRIISITVRTFVMIAALMLLLLTGSAGGVPVEEWNRTFGGADDDIVYSVQLTSDGGYVLSGETYSYGNVLSGETYAYGGGDAWLIKTDINGNEQWNKTFGGVDEDKVFSAYQADDGGYILIGYTKSYGSGLADAWLINTDINGNERWNKTFGGKNNDFAYSGHPTSDGGYILSGETYAYGEGDAWFIKTDKNGNEQWNKTFGGTSEDIAFSVQQTEDGYIIAGSTSSYGSGLADAWLVKTDLNGHEQWNRTFGGKKYDFGYSLQQTSDGYIIAGSTSSYGSGLTDFWLVKTDLNGNEQWNRTFGGASQDDFESVQHTSDGYILAGSTYSYGAGNYDAWLIKTDMNGNELWNKTFGGASKEIASSVQQTSDGYILAGSTWSHTGGPVDALLIKVGSNGTDTNSSEVKATIKHADTLPDFQKPPEKSIPGFEIILAAGALCAVYWFRGIRR